MARAFVPQVTAAEQRSRDAGGRARRSWPCSSAETRLGVPGRFRVFPPRKGVRLCTAESVCVKINSRQRFRISSVPLAAFGDRGPYGQSVAAPPPWEASRCAPPSALRGPAVTTAPDAPPGTVPGAGCRDMRFLLSPCEAGRNTQVLSRRARHRPALSDRRARALSPSVRLPFCAREGGERPGLGDPSTLVSISATTGKLPAGSACSDIHMALCAVNLAECAEEKIPPSTLVEIHLTAAMGLKTRCGGKLGFLAVSTCSPGSQPLPGGSPGQEPRQVWALPPVPAAWRGRHSFSGSFCKYLWQ